MSNARKWNEILRYEREAHNWTQAQVAQALRTDPKRVSEWEVGKTKPSYKYRKMLLKLFSKNAQELGFLAEEFSDEAPDDGNPHNEDSDQQDDRNGIAEEASLPLESPAETEVAQPIQLFIPKATLVTIQIRQTSSSTSPVKDDMITIEETSYLPVFGSESSMYMEYQRREFLHILGVASTALLLSFPLDWERIGDALEKPSRLMHL